jgi:hypothetical protein
LIPRKSVFIKDSQNKIFTYNRKFKFEAFNLKDFFFDLTDQTFENWKVIQYFGKQSNLSFQFCVNFLAEIYQPILFMSANSLKISQ